ncbi:MAG: ATP-binding SpoIIE family protein phosphatase [Mycobacteriales bacterium]
MTVTLHEQLPAEGRSASRARRVVEHALRDADLTTFLDEALLLVTEIVTNAVVHAGTDVELAVEVKDGRLWVEVVDRSPGSLPVVQELPDQTREGGRGVFLLHSLATEWGTRHFTDGKAVWFALGPDRAPRRTCPHPPPAPSAAARDISWLVGLPADLEQRLSSKDLITELLHRLTEALGLRASWLFVEPVDDDRSWQLAATHDPTATAPGPEAVRRCAQPGRDGVLPEDPGMLVLPLRSRSAVFGALVLGDSRALTAEDVALARLVGDRVSVVLRDDRAQLSQLRDRSSLALLAEASEMFAATLDVQLALTLAAQMVVPRFASWAALLTAYDEQPRVMAVAHEDEARLASVREGLSTAEGQELAEQLVRELATQRPLLLPATRLPEEVGERRTGELLAVPLVARHRLLGLLLLGRSARGRYAADDVGLLTDLCRRAALAVDNARLYEDRTAVAQALQASLLPPTLPRGEQVEFGARYAAAGEGNEVGGDFYDVFPVGEDAWGIAIGDVCGKGPEAAAITGMARDVLRLLVRTGAPLSEALRHLNDTILELGDRSRFCTAAVGVVRRQPEGLHMRLSSAGHPPPVLLTAAGQVSLHGRSGTLLGVVPDIDVVEDEVLLAPGDGLVFYTDGVTERRLGSEMFGDDNLLACVRAAGGRSADAVAGQLEDAVRRFSSASTRDDLAVLVVRCTGAEPS